MNTDYIMQKYPPEKITNSFNFIKIKEKFSIQVCFDYKKKIDLKILFSIIKGYANNPLNLLKCVLVVSSEKIDHKASKTYHNIKIRKLQKINYIDFEIFFEELLDNDWKYLEEMNHQMYGFQFVFFRESINWIEEKIYPII